jgi:hypothetical protein
LATAALVRNGRVCIYLTNESSRALIDESLEVNIVDCRQGKIKEVTSKRPDRREIAMEENGMKNC